MFPMGSQFWKLKTTVVIVFINNYENKIFDITSFNRSLEIKLKFVFQSIFVSSLPID